MYLIKLLMKESNGVSSTNFWSLLKERRDVRQYGWQYSIFGNKASIDLSLEIIERGKTGKSCECCFPIYFSLFLASAVAVQCIAE